MKAGYLGAASVEKIDDKMFICVNNTAYNTMTQIIMFVYNTARSVGWMFISAGVCCALSVE